MIVTGTFRERTCIQCGASPNHNWMRTCGLPDCDGLIVIRVSRVSIETLPDDPDPLDCNPG